jgi:hypothetical protein
MMYLARTALSALFLLPLAAISTNAQIMVPGTPPRNPNQTPGQHPNQYPNQCSNQYPDQCPNQYPNQIPGQYPNQDPSAKEAGRPVPVNPTANVPPPDPAPAIEFPVKDKDSRLSEDAKLQLIRYVSGEFARARTALPGGKKGFRVKAGEPMDQRALVAALRENGVAISPGDDLQITKLDFGGSDIVVEINGGGNQVKSWRDRVQVSGGMGGVMGPTTRSSTTTTDDYGAAPAASRVGITVRLDFVRPLPDMTPDELKLYMSTFLDFSKQRSAALQWSESQPPEIRAAITAHRAEIGMDQDQVIAALGRADRKVRERDPEGTDTEDWIYGQPPGKTIFVRFAHDKVIRVSQYPLPVASAAQQAQ